MLYFDFPLINKIHKLIDPDDIYEEDEDKTFGLEDEPHTTLLYGLHPEVSLGDVEKVLDSYTYYPCTIKNASLFKNEKYDVLKFDVEGENLHETNDDLKKYPFTNDYPKYHPHLTIGYIKPGLGEKYSKILEEMSFQLIPQYAVYSHPDGSKDKIKIKTNDR